MLEFDEASHTYTLKNQVLKSVSAVVASQFRSFNSHAVARAIAKKKGSKYYGMSHDDILKQWDETGKESRDRGLSLHRDIENFYKYGKIPINEDAVEWKYFLKFHQDHPEWLCIGNEVQVYNDKVAGTIDAVFDTPDGVVLVDWKRCKTIDYSGYGMGKAMMRHVSDCNYSKYSLQLSLYKALISLKVSGCFIIQLHPVLETYQKIRAQDFHIEAKYLIS